ncbi:MAG: replication-associated recombination protein A, partial [Planctomycetota bacterium]
MRDLFKESEDEAIRRNAPLAARMRPRSLDEVVGQDQFVAEGKMLRRMLEADRLSSVVFYGPPGTGKTTMAHVIAAEIECDFHELNAASASVKDVRAIIEQARAILASTGRRTVLFLDEIHRFNRAQQDVLLNDVETGTIILVGATTENPFFTVNTPLLSRSTVFQFTPLDEDDVLKLLQRALDDDQRGLGRYNVQADEQALEYLARICDGDARRALTALEVGVRSQVSAAGDVTAEVKFDMDVAAESIQQKVIRYDQAGEEHYDAASALIKSMRGSDPDAAVYWLARMLAAGEDPRFIARRVAILASEDIGNADPKAIQVAAAAYSIVERVGMPECRITLAQAVVYMASAPKSNASYLAIDQAMADVRNQRTQPVPKHLRNAPHAGMKEQLGYSEGYKYSHDYEGGISPDQQYLGVDKQYYTPTDRGYEKHIAAYLDYVAKLQGRGQGQADDR